MPALTHPATRSPAVPDDGTTGAARALAVLNVPDAVLSASALKDRREHERARQRAKKAGDRAKGRKGHAYAHDHADIPHVKAEREKRGGSGGGGGGLVPGADAEWDAARAAPDDVDLVRAQIAFGVFGAAWARKEVREVRLADLVRPAKKAHRKQGCDADFELVPHIRSVIALDDAMDDASELDEPWEYVSGESEGEARKAPSYAQVVAKQD
ncbi:hypothetical protein HETIRDRAFT_145098 [Heterobasidion irregulare TC 32-1]|uniref:Uncharacterized protein n=1 Tax=Heterobasidion irregulare (strain TC 32-1) TaxID=747525 RepID=W4KLL1_HETIT|nr:uncharacterized protein HETIRDRAFT_145098 [Heterobasidion irregulare TC 32-1]ETW86589.1 hypothetical protein HETIRDRAFT_145098 [Heterobasidion irregulare TC 32-1]